MLEHVILTSSFIEHFEILEEISCSMIIHITAIGISCLITSLGERFSSKYQYIITIFELISAFFQASSPKNWKGLHYLHFLSVNVLSWIVHIQKIYARNNVKCKIPLYTYAFQKPNSLSLNVSYS